MATRLASSIASLSVSADRASQRHAPDATGVHELRRALFLGERERVGERGRRVADRRRRRGSAQRVEAARRPGARSPPTRASSVAHAPRPARARALHAANTPSQSPRRRLSTVRQSSDRSRIAASIADLHGAAQAAEDCAAAELGAGGADREPAPHLERRPRPCRALESLRGADGDVGGEAHARPDLIPRRDR